LRKSHRPFAEEYRRAPGKLTEKAERVILNAGARIFSQAILASFFRPIFETEATGSMAHRRKHSPNWARGILATFWILLAGVSGLYLFSAFNDPTLGGQLISFGPQASSETTSAFFGGSARDRELAEIKESLRELTQQVAALNAQLKPEVSTPDPSGPEPKTEAGPEAKPEAAENTAAPSEESADAKSETPAVREASPNEVKPTEQATLNQDQPAAPATPVVPVPEQTEPPQVAVAPLEPPADEVPEGAGLTEPTRSSPPLEGTQTAESAEESPSPASSSPTSTPTPAPDSDQAQPPAADTAALDPIALPPAANDGSTRYGIEIGSVAKQDALRPLWREFLTRHAALVAGLQPRRVLAPDKKWRLIAGPFSSADEAEQACALFKKASRPCEATVYAGDAL